MIYHILYTVALLLLVIMLILAKRKISRLKDQNLTLRIDLCNLKGYNGVLSHVNSTRLDTINRLNTKIKNLKRN